MSAWMMHRNEDIFPDPDKFNPERWLDPSAARTLERNLVAFGKGSRMCVGMSYVPYWPFRKEYLSHMAIRLAYCEIYVTLATFILRFQHIKIHNTTVEDLEFEDYFATYNPINNRKTHVIGI